MPTYEYECRACGARLEQSQEVNDAPLTECPQCGGTLQRVISGGLGSFVKGASPAVCEQPAPCCGRLQGCNLEDCRRN